MEEKTKEDSDNNTTIDIEQYEYLPLNPVKDDSYEPNAKLLFNKVKDESIKNIGIIGSYGSGKSSLIKTFDDCYKKNGKIKSLNVSLASFNGDSFNNAQDNDDSRDGKQQKNHESENFVGVGDIDNAIEKSILQQMLYVESSKKLPFSKINRVESISIGKYLQIGIIAVLLSILVVCLEDIFSNISSSTVPIFEYLFNQKTWSTIISMVAIISIVLLLVRLIKIARIKFHQVEIDINNTRGSLLNRFLDEVLYFFTKTKYNVVIFEDLDRFKNLNIFVKLRELNTILNSNKTIAKHGKITFIYAVKSNIFSEHTERTKFFDFILNVYPTLSTENACAIINEGLKKSKLGGSWLSENFKYDISFFVQDRRVLNSVINDCIQFIQNCKKTNLYDALDKHELMFSVMLYKNVCPNEYAKLEHHEGELIEILDQVEEIRNKKIEDLKAKLNDTKQKLSDADSLPNIRYLIKSILFENFNSRISYDRSAIDVNKIDDFSNGNQFIYYRPHVGAMCAASINSINQYIKGGTLESKYRSNKKIEELNHECTKLNGQILEIPRNNFEFVKSYSDESFEGRNVTPLLRALLANGYINENYVDYISMGNEESMSENDFAFCRLVVSKSSPKFEAVINAPSVILKRLTVDKFLVPSILNISFCNYVIEHNDGNYAEKIENLKNLFKSGKSEIGDFIKCYFSDVKYCSEPFVGFLIDNEVDCIVYLLESPLADHEKIKIIKQLLLNANPEKFIKQKSIDLIGDLLKKDSNFNENITIYKPRFNVLNAINYKISDITKYDYDESTLHVIEENNLWELDYGNLLYIVSKLYEKNTEEINEQGISLINKLAINIRDYILHDKAYYVHNIMLKTDALELNEADFKNLLLDNCINNEDKLDIIIKQKMPIQYASNLSLEMQIALLDNDKVQAKCQELNSLLSANNGNSELKSAIAKYMYIHAETFKDFKANIYTPLAYCIVNYKEFEDDRLIEAYYARERLTGFNWDVSQITNEKSIIFMLNKDMIAINLRNVTAISDNYPKASKVLVEKNIENLISNKLINANLARIYIESENHDLKFVSRLCMMDNLDFVDSWSCASKLQKIIIENKIEISDKLYDRLMNYNKKDSEKLDRKKLFISQWDYIKNNEQKIKDKLLKIDYDVYNDLVNKGEYSKLDASFCKKDNIFDLLKDSKVITMSGRKYLSIKWVGINDIA